MFCFFLFKNDISFNLIIHIFIRNENILFTHHIASPACSSLKLLSPWKTDFQGKNY